MGRGIISKTNYLLVIKKMRQHEKSTGDTCSIKKTKIIISETIDRVDIGVINKFLKGMTELGYLNRKGNRYEVSEDTKK